MDCAQMAESERIEMPFVGIEDSWGATTRCVRGDGGRDPPREGGRR